MDISTVPARHKLLVIISDFQFGGGADTSNLLLKVKHAGIQTIAIADAGEYDTTGQSAKQSATYSLPGRHAFFIVHGLKEVVPSLLAYLRNFYRGTPTPGAWWTPDRAGAPCTQTPSARRP
jgi:hypothetical protein